MLVEGESPPYRAPSFPASSRFSLAAHTYTNRSTPRRSSPHPPGFFLRPLPISRRVSVSELLLTRRDCRSEVSVASGAASGHPHETHFLPVWLSPQATIVATPYDRPREFSRAKRVTLRIKGVGRRGEKETYLTNYCFVKT